MTKHWADRGPDPRAANFVWAAVFNWIGVMLIINRPVENTGGFVMFGGLSIAVGLACLTRAALAR